MVLLNKPTRKRSLEPAQLVAGTGLADLKKALVTRDNVWVSALDLMTQD